MLYLAFGLLSLLLTGSVYTYMHSLQETKRKQELFYSEIKPYIKEAVVREDRSSFPSIEGYYKNFKIKVIPHVDNLGLRSLPRLYARVYILINNKVQFRIVRTNERKHLFPPANLENGYNVLAEKSTEFALFYQGEQSGRCFDTGNITDILSGIDDCAEILVRKNFIRVTLLLAKGEKRNYAVLRAVKFPVLVLNYEHFRKTIKLLLKLREEVAGIEKVC